jgi:hypothetical protein
MSSAFKPIRKLQDKLTPKFLRKAQGLDIGRPLGEIADPKLPKIPELPKTPTIDDAQKNRDQQDRLRRRRGVLANIFGGQSASPSSGAKQTLGG